MLERKVKFGAGWLAASLLTAATVLAYLPAIRGGFLWDDDMHVTRPELQSLRGLGRIWCELGATQQYYPVLHSAFWIEHRLWGEAPLGYHLANVLLHAAAACLFARVLRRLAIPGAWLAALIFALHPIGVESVAWISEQKNTLSAVFYLAAALVYLRFEAARGVERVVPNALVRPRSLASALGTMRSTRCYLLATALFILALLTKSVTATLPAALLVVFWWKRGRLSWRRDVAPLLPWLVLGAAAGGMTAWVERRYVGAEGADFALGAVERALVAGRAVGFYLGHLAWPADLIFVYPRWHVNARVGWQYFYPAGVLALAGALWRYARRGRAPELARRAPLAALFFYVGALFPALGFFNVYPFIFSYVADHFQYLASLGPIALAAASLPAFAMRKPPRRSATREGGAARLRALNASYDAANFSASFAALKFGGWQVVTVVLLCLLGTLTWRQCGMYRDAETLYRVTLERNPSAWMAHNNLGLILADSGRLPEAISHYERALRLKPDFALGEFDLGNALRADGRREEAMGHFEAALRLQPSYPEAENNLGAALVDVGRLPEAAIHYQSALRLRPDDAAALVGLSVADLRMGRTADAIAAAEAAVRLQPDDADARYDLADALVHAGRREEAVAPFQAAVRLRPGFIEAHQNLGAVERSLGRTAEADAEQAEAARLRAEAPARH